MKVLGTNGHASYFVEMRAGELKNLLGEYGSDYRVNASYIGRELPINAMFTTIKSLKCATNELPALANKLRALADLLEPIQCEIPTEVKESDDAE